MGESTTQPILPIELDLMDGYQWIDPPRLLEAISGKGWIQELSHFQLDLLFSRRPCNVEKQDSSSHNSV